MSTGRRRARLVALLLAVFIVHASLGSVLAIRGARPNLALAALLVSSLYVRAETGAALGFMVGLLEASFSAAYVGSFLVSRSLAGWTIGALEERMFRDNVAVAIATVAVGTLLVEGCFFVFAPQPHIVRWGTRVLWEVLYNTALAAPLFLLARRAARPREPR